jgi:DeoR/GlpR family transcriptional regulator of sugar metabolism
MRLGYINERQAQVIQRFVDDPNEVITVKEMQERFSISPTTAKQDIVNLMERGLLKEISFKKVKKGYIEGELFDAVLAAIK